MIRGLRYRDAPQQWHLGHRRFSYRDAPQQWYFELESTDTKPQWAALGQLETHSPLSLNARASPRSLATTLGYVLWVSNRSCLPKPPQVVKQPQTPPKTQITVPLDQPQGMAGVRVVCLRKCDGNKPQSAGQQHQVSRSLQCERFARATRDFGPLRAVLGHTTRVLTYHVEWLRF